MGAEVKSMDIKKTQPTSTTDRTLNGKRVEEFVTDMKGEISKIHWTSKEELITYSKIVVGMTFIFGMAIYLMDLLIQGGLGVLNFLLRFIVG